MISVPESPYGSLLIYDRSFGRWLGMPWAWVSSDGSRYIYRGGDGSIHLAAVAGGSDKVLVAGNSSPSGGGWFPVALTDQAIYIAVGSHEPAAPAPYYGLWSVNSNGGGLKQIVQSGVWNAIDHGAAWGVTPQTAVSLNRLDLTTGRQVAWYAPPDGFVSLYDFDAAGYPVVGLTRPNGGYRVGFLTAKDTLRVMGLPIGIDWGTAGHYVQNGLAAQAGIWLTVQDGTLLFSPQGTDFKLVAVVPGVSNVAAGCH